MFKKQLNSSKWSGKTEGEHYPLTLADMDFPLYQPFKKNLIKQIKTINNLTYKDRSSQYFQSIKNWYHKHHHVVLYNNDLVECPSICNLIGTSILAFTQQNQNILIFTPVYSFYINSIKQLKRQIVVCQMKQTQKQQKFKKTPTKIYQYQFDEKDFVSKIQQYKPKLIILCNPHNPSGKIFSKQQLDLIISIAIQYQAYVLSDQIMGDFTLFPVKDNEKQNKKRKFISLATYSYDKIIVGNSISKVFNCQSVQGGYGIIKSQQVRNLYKKIGLKSIKLLTNELSNILTPIIYCSDGQKWIRYINQLIKINYQLLKSAFKQQKSIKIFQLQSSYLTTIQFGFSHLNIAPFTNKQLSDIMKSFGIYFTDIQQYYYPPAQRNIFRISIAIHPKIFKKFISKYKGFIQYFIQNSKNKQTGKSNNLLQKSKL